MRRSLVLLSVLLCGLAAVPLAQPPSAVDPALLTELTWRNIGPHRASRTRAMTGVVQEPHTFYIGISNGGVWKTTDAGRTWAPIFDRESTGSTGAIAVAGHRTSVGTTRAGTTVTAIRDRNHLTVYDPDGQPLGHLRLDPDRSYITLTRAA